MAKENSGKEKQPAKQQPPTATFLFNRQNYLILLAGIILIALGFSLMTGGQQPPDQWDEKVIYSFRRISLSTIVVVLGLVVVLVSIFWKTRKS